MRLDSTYSTTGLLALLPAVLILIQPSTPLSELSPPEEVAVDTTALPQEVRDFLSPSLHPYGQRHPDAPPELDQFDCFIGVWRTTSHAYVNNQWFSGWQATWVWTYAFGGFGIKDLFFHAQEDLPPPMATFGRDTHLMTTRVYDPTIKEWRVHWMSNFSGFQGNPSGGTYRATYENGRIIMRSPTKDGQPLSRIVFSNIRDSSFTWTPEFSEDGGQTWNSTQRVEAKRIR